MSVAISKNDVPIRLTEERWFHIVENHDEMAGFFDEVLSTVEDPDFVIQGYGDAVIALRAMGKKKFMAAIYKEIDKKDEFVITAFITSKVRTKKEVILWEKKS